MVFGSLISIVLANFSIYYDHLLRTRQREGKQKRISLKSEKISSGSQTIFLAFYRAISDENVLKKFK